MIGPILVKPGTPALWYGSERSDRVEDRLDRKKVSQESEENPWKLSSITDDSPTSELVQQPPRSGPDHGPLNAARQVGDVNREWIEAAILPTVASSLASLPDLRSGPRNRPRPAGHQLISTPLRLAQTTNHTRPHQAKHACRSRSIAPLLHLERRFTTDPSWRSARATSPGSCARLPRFSGISRFEGSREPAPAQAARGAHLMDRLTSLGRSTLLGAHVLRGHAMTRW